MNLIDLLNSLCKNGLPTGDIFEFAALQVLKYEKKWYDLTKQCSEQWSLKIVLGNKSRGLS